MHNIHYEYLKPSWKNCHTCHDWKNYVTGGKRSGITLQTSRRSLSGNPCKKLQIERSGIDAKN
ncbi:hypothetical protein 2018Mat002_0185 [Vibrio phage ICP1]|nr:hypothetical protein 2018Mat001_0190 [Vibrio phage ICP1]QVW04758.1 hypothetical protein 2018Mat002_0185 [Vibrio phage ICP1]QVW05422.1 hypothetical protein 2018Mat160_0160 [Vibrio phage ICP1]QVW06775.1 hypothetical protein 2019Dha007_0185 [Vibrio phage ICP1]QVW06997.1 hypothetical protein 2019DhaG_0185 [Vibrio phage ICP1]